MRPLRDRLEYVIEDMGLQAGILERDTMVSMAEGACNRVIAMILRREAKRLRDMVDQDRKDYP